METLDVLIGLVTIYLAFGIATTACVEAVSSLFGLRAKNLQTAMGELFSGNLGDDRKVVDAIYANPLVATLSRGKKGLPSYVPKAIVSQVVTSLVVAGETGESLAQGIAKLPAKNADGEPNRVKELLRELVERTDGSAEQFRAELEGHFDAVMERASGWYKRKVQVITLVVAAVLVVGANVDTVEIARTLATSPEVRERLVQVATSEVKKEEVVGAAAADSVEVAAAKTDRALARTQEAFALSGAASLGIGWQAFHPDPSAWVTKVFGLLVSLFAVSLGAPFWFNVLRNLVNLRATGMPQPTGASATTGPGTPDGSKK